MFPTEGDLQGDRRDDPHGGQERGREDQLQRVQGEDGGAPTHIYLYIIIIYVIYYISYICYHNILYI